MRFFQEAPLDLALHVAAGRDWHGVKVRGGPVVYVAGEGGFGIGNRIAAARIEWPDLLGDADLYLLRNTLDLCGDDFAEIEDYPGARPQFLGPVTQTETGTVAVVNFSNGAIFDTSVTVPGVTALQVGEQPTGIQVSPVDSRYTFQSRIVG